MIFPCFAVLYIHAETVCIRICCKDQLSFGFFEYAKVGLPILIAGILYFAFIGYKFLPEKQGSTESSYDEQKDFSNVPKWKQMMSLIILILTLLGMIFEDKIGIKLCVIGCVGALALIITGVISEKNALKSIDLKTIFLFGGTLSLAAALQETGAGEEIATAVIGILGKNPSPYVLINETQAAERAEVLYARI